MLFTLDRWADLYQAEHAIMHAERATEKADAVLERLHILDAGGANTQSPTPSGGVEESQRKP